MFVGNGYVDFLPFLTSVPSPSLTSRSAVRESCGEPKRGISCPYGPAGAFRDLWQKVPAPALVPSSSVLNRGGEGLQVSGDPHPLGKRVGLPATGAGAILSYCGSLGGGMISSSRDT